MLLAVRLLDEPLWRRFNQVQNEMIITRSGRCLFPLLKLVFEPIGEAEAVESGVPVMRLTPGHRFAIGLGIVQADRMRWRFRSGQWQPILSASSSESQSSSSSQPSLGSSPRIRLRMASAQPVQVYEPEPAMTLQELLTDGISFARVKLSNRPTDAFQAAQTGLTFCLTSFHRYVPRLFILDQTASSPPFESIAQTLADEPESSAILRLDLPLANFIAVTHYQNELVTELKKNFNPHAKGFLIRPLAEPEEVSENDSDLSKDEILASKALAALSSPPPQ